MQKITKLFEKKEKTFSFEFFPPKTETGYEKLITTIEHLSKLNPDFISCTYGAGGGNRDKTFHIVEHIQNHHKIIGVAHLTCVLNTKEDIKNILDDIKSRNICNILALRGDPPQEFPNWVPGENNFQYSYQLCQFIRQEYGNFFSIGVAGFPEGHISCHDRELDAKYLKIKIDSGADFVITQLFFDNRDYFEYVQRLKKIGVTVRVIPGILPITNYQNLLKFCSMCGASIPEEVKNIFEPLKDNAEATLQEGIKFAIRQCKDLLKNGAAGIHFYTLNKISPVFEILSEIKKQN